MTISQYKCHTLKCENFVRSYCLGCYYAHNVVILICVLLLICLYATCYNVLFTAVLMLELSFVAFTIITIFHSFL